MNIALTCLAGAILVTPGISLAAPGGTPAGGWDHNITVPVETGQPGKECDEDGPPPGQAEDASGSAFNEDGTAHGVYAGEQDRNSRNSASVSQYDTACFRQPTG